MRNKITLFLSLFTVLVFVGCKADQVTESVLALSSTNDLYFTASRPESIPIEVATNLESWTVQSNKDWCVVSQNASKTSFSVSVKPSFDHLNASEATITVSGLSGSQVVKTVTLKASQDIVVSSMLRETTTWVDIPKGEFTMGSEFGSEANRPSHKVILTKGFKMSAYEVTNAQFAAFLNANQIGAENVTVVREIVYGYTPENEELSDKDDVNLIVAKGPTESNGVQPYITDCTFDPNTPLVEHYPDYIPSPLEFGLQYVNGKWAPVKGFDNHPVVNVTWYGARAYAHWIGGELPTEAQWEYACRAGSKTDFYYGTNYRIVNLYGVVGTASTQPVGRLIPNAWGLYDMYGNAAEICLDSFTVAEVQERDGRTYGNFTVTDPVCYGTDAVMSRGGGFNDMSMYISSISRNWVRPFPFYWENSFMLGFRVVINSK